MNPSSLWRAHALLARLYQATKHIEDARQAWMAATDTLEKLAATLQEEVTYAMPSSSQHRWTCPGLFVSHIHVLSRRRVRPAERAGAGGRRVDRQGKSNHEIAGTLVLSERTVTTHVTHILGKLGFTSRTQ